MSKVVEINLTLNKGTNHWSVQVKKEFDPEHGGGSQVFTENGGTGIHTALQTAVVMLLPSFTTIEELYQTRWGGK